MPYPIISKTEARQYLQAVDAAADAEQPQPGIPGAGQVVDGPDEDWDSIGVKIAAKLETLMAQFGGKGSEVKGSEFEAAAGPQLHRTLPEHPALADPEFWIWLTLTYCQGVVDWRYPGKRNLKNFGIGGTRENLLYRLWLRAEIGHVPDANDAYELARVGDIDFWRSHVFRQSYSDVRLFARALIQFQFPAKKSRQPRLKIDDIRALAKHLKRARSNLMFELMSESRASTFVESEWERLASEAG